MDEQMLGVALFLAVMNKYIVDCFSEPIRQKYPGLDLWWLVYVASVTGFILTWSSGINLFIPIMPENELFARFLTAVAVGGGSSLLHKIVQKFPVLGVK